MTMYFSPCDNHRTNSDLSSIIQSSFSNCKILEILEKDYSEFVGIFISPDNKTGKFIKKQLLEKNSKQLLSKFSLEFKYFTNCINNTIINKINKNFIDFIISKYNI